MLRFFETEKVTDKITRINTNFKVCMYYIQGDDMGVLIDTGIGYGDLKSFVDSISTTPYKVILSHGHYDHAGGSGQFKEVYLNYLDYKLAKDHCNSDLRIKMIERVSLENTSSTKISEQIVPIQNNSYKELTEETIFELGNITIQPILVPGHTQGMMAFLIVEEKVIIFGDASGENTLICLPESTSIAEHLEGLKKLKKLEGQYTRILRNHGTFESPLFLLDNNIATCKKIISGTDDRMPVKFQGINALSGKNRDIISLDEDKIGNIIYTLDKL